MANVLNLPTETQFNEQITVLREIAGKMGVAGSIGSWNDVVAICRRRDANRYLKVGDTLASSYNGIRAVVDLVLWEIHQ